MSFIFTADDMKLINDKQKAAIISACVAAASADGTINKAEVDKIEAEMAKVPWGMPQQLIVEIAKAAAQKLNELRDAASVQSYISATAAYLPAGTIREKTFYLIASVMFADKDVSQAEKNLLGAFAQAFAIPADRLQAIAAAVKSS